MDFGVKYDVMARRSDCIFQQTFLTFKAWLVLDNTAAAATICVTTFTPLIKAKVWRPKLAFLEDDLYAFRLSGQKMFCEKYHGFRCLISKYSIPHQGLLSPVPRSIR